MKLSILLLFFCLPLCLVAQNSGWLPGYVVTIQGDTFSGFIKKGNNILSDAKYDASHGIRFKNSRGIKIYFTPPFVRSYVRANERFITYKSKLGKDVWAVFIKQLVVGPMSLYIYYGDKKSYMYFLKKPGSNFVFVESDNAELTFNRIRIKTMLLEYFRDCPAVVKKIEDGTYRIYNLRLKDIPLMVEEYNKCMSSQP